jgi:hypothetical protein
MGFKGRRILYQLEITSKPVLENVTGLSLFFPNLTAAAIAAEYTDVLPYFCAILCILNVSLL